MENKIKKSVVVKATLWYTVSRVLIRGISFFTAPLFTRLLSTSDYGIASNFSSWTSIISCFAGLSLATAALRGKVEFKENYERYLSSIQTLGMLSSLICAAIIISTINFWCGVMELNQVCIIIMMLYLIFEPSVSYAQIDFQFDYKYKENIGISLFTVLGTVIFSVIFVLLWPDMRYMGRILGMALPCIIIGLYFAVQIFRKGRLLYNWKYWKYGLELSLPMIPHGLAMIVLGQIDRVMIIKYTGESAAGIYSFGYSYAILLSVITNSISDGIKPQMYNFLEKGEDAELAGFMKRIVAGMSFLTLGIISVAPEALKVLGTKDYYDARWVIFPVAVGTLMQFMYQNFNIVQLYYKKTVYTAIGSVMAAIINFVLNMLFIPRYGYIAAAYTTMISYGLLMLFHYCASWFVAKRKVYKFTPYAFYSSAAILIGFVFNLLYDQSALIRYTMILFLILAIGMYFRQEINLGIKAVKKRYGKP